MPQAIAHPVWKMIWTTALKTGPWSNKPCMGPTSLCIKFLEPKRGVGPGPRKMGPGWTRVGPGGTRVGSLRVLFFLRNIEIAGPCGSPAGPSFPRQNARAGPCGSPFLWVLHHTPFGLYNVN